MSSVVEKKEEGIRSLSPERPEEWMDRPLTSNDLPEQWRGWTYKTLAQDAAGRDAILASRAKDGDPFAIKVLSMFAAAAQVATEAPFVEVPFESAAPEPQPPIAATPEPPKAEAPAPAPAQSDDGKIKFKARSKVQVTVAENDLAAAERAVNEHNFLTAIESAEEVEDDTFMKLARDGEDVIVAQSKARMAREDIVRSLVENLRVDTPHTASYAVRLILGAEDDLEKFKREMNALLYRYERRLKIRDYVLRPKIEEWAQKADRTSAKGIRLPNTTQRITFKWTEPGYDVRDEKEAKKAAEQKLGLDGAIVEGVIKVKEELSRSGLSEWLDRSKYVEKSEGEDFPGTAFVAGHDEMVLYRK